MADLFASMASAAVAFSKAPVAPGEEGGGGSPPIMAFTTTSATGSPPPAASNTYYEEVMRKKQMHELKTDLDLLRAKLIRRNGLMEELVKAYHRDIISMKQELLRKETTVQDDKTPYKVGTEVRDNVPSLDLRGYLQLFAPSENYMRLKPCDTCGGQLEILHHESQKMEALAKKNEELEEIKAESEQIIIGYRAQLSQAKSMLEQERLRTSVDRQVFEDRVLELKAELAKFDVREINQMRHSIVLLRNQNKEQSAKVQQMSTLQMDLEKVLSENTSLQNALTEKTRALAILDRDKSLAEELAMSSGRKCEILEHDATKMVASNLDLQKRLKAEIEQTEQLQKTQNRMQKAIADSHKIDHAMKAKIHQLQKTVDELLEKNDGLKKDLEKTSEDLERASSRTSTSTSASRPATSTSISTSTSPPRPSTSDMFEPVERATTPARRNTVTTATQTQPLASSPPRPTPQPQASSLPPPTSDPPRASPTTTPPRDTTPEPDHRHPDNLPLAAFIDEQVETPPSPRSPEDSPRSPGQIYLVKIPGPQPSPPSPKIPPPHDQLPGGGEGGGGGGGDGPSPVGIGPPRGRRRSSGTVALTVGADGSVGITGIHWDDGRTVAGDKSHMMEEELNELKAELKEEKESRDIVERSFIRVTSKHFFQADPDAAFYNDGEADAITVVEENPAQRAERVAEVKKHFIEAVQQVLKRQEVLGGFTRARHDNETIQQMLEENETLTAKLVRAHREKELALDNLNKALKDIDDKIHHKAKELIRLGHYKAEKNKRESSSEAPRPSVVVQVDTERIKELMEKNLQCEEQIHKLGLEIEGLNKTIQAEREKGEKLNGEVQSKAKRISEVEQLLEKETSKVEGLREVLKEKLQEVSQLVTDKNEQSLAFNYQLQRKQDELDGTVKLKEEAQEQVESTKKAVATLMASMIRTCKAMEGSMERRVSTVELKGVESFIRDPGGKMVARRFEKKESVGDDELTAVVDSAKAFEAPLLYLATRNEWALQNLRNYIESLRETRKELTVRLQEGEAAVLRVEMEVKERERAMAEQRVSMEEVISQKEMQITGLVTNVEVLKGEMRKIDTEYKALKDVDTKCRDLTRINEELKVAEGRAAQQARDMADEVTVIRHENEVLSLTAQKVQTQLDTVITKSQELQMDLEVTRADLVTTSETVTQLQEVVRQDEIRRETSVSVGIQSTPEVEEREIQTQFFVPDMNLRASISLEKNTSDRIFVERVITPSLITPSLRRCTTALPSGTMVVTGSDQTLYDPVPYLQSSRSTTRVAIMMAPQRRKASFSLAGGGNLLDALAPGTQPIGTLRDELLDYMTPASRKMGALLPPRTLTMPSAMSSTRGGARTLAPLMMGR